MTPLPRLPRQERSLTRQERVILWAPGALLMLPFPMNELKVKLEALNRQQLQKILTATAGASLFWRESVFAC